MQGKDTSKFHSILSFLYLCKVMSRSKSFIAKLWRSLGEKLKESLTSVLPVSVLVFALSLTPWVDISHHELAVFEGAALLLIIGIGLFNLGQIWQ